MTGSEDKACWAPKGCCFICLKPGVKSDPRSVEQDHDVIDLEADSTNSCDINNDFARLFDEDDDIDTSIPSIKLEDDKTHSFNGLARYLNINFARFIKQTVSVLPDARNLLKTAEVRVELCEECEKAVKKFEDVAEKMYLLKMEMDYWMETVSGRIRDHSMNEMDGKLKHSLEQDIGPLNLEIMKLLRKETLQKCQSKIQDNFIPWVQIRRINEAEQKANELILVEKIKQSWGKPEEQLISEQFRSSMPTRSTEAPDECNICHKMFPSNLFQHLYQDHFGFGGRPEGKDQDKYSKPKPMKQKLEDYLNQRKCKICQMNFQCRKDLEQHMESIHFRKKINCLGCRLQFKFRSAYDNHVKVKHDGTPPSPAAAEPVLDPLGNENDLLDPTRGDQMEMDWDGPDYQKREKKGMEVRPLAQTTSNLDLDMKEYPCIACKTKFKSRKELETHTYVDHKIGTRGTLKARVDSVRQGMFYGCHLCDDIRFGTIEDLTMHRNEFHRTNPEKRKFQCPYCRSWQNRQSTHKKHMALHAQQKVPTLIKKGFAKGTGCSLPISSSLQTGTKPKNKTKSKKSKQQGSCSSTSTIEEPSFPSRFPREGSKAGNKFIAPCTRNPFVCIICKTRFPLKTELDEHDKVVHDALTCPVCKTSFENFVQVNLHMMEVHKCNRVQYIQSQLANQNKQN